MLRIDLNRYEEPIPLLTLSLDKPLLPPPVTLEEKEKMEELSSCKSSDSQKKQRESSKKQPTFKPFTKNSRPKVMISRDSIINKKIKDSSGSPSLSFIEESSSELQGTEEKDACHVEHLYCNENATNFKEELDVCLISSSSEIQGSLKVSETSRGNKKVLKKFDSAVEENDFDCASEESIISNTREKQTPIFVDLTADEKSTRKQTTLKRFCDVKADMTNEKDDENERCTTNIALGTEHCNR